MNELNRLEEENEVLRAKLMISRTTIEAAEAENRLLRAKVSSPLQVIAIISVLALTFWIVISL